MITEMTHWTGCEIKFYSSCVIIIFHSFFLFYYKIGGMWGKVGQSPLKSIYRANDHCTFTIPHLSKVGGA